jgi:hypothetical protein
MPQLLLLVLLLAAAVIAAYFYWKRAQAREGRNASPQSEAAPSAAAPGDRSEG